MEQAILFLSLGSFVFSFVAMINSLKTPGASMPQTVRNILKPKEKMAPKVHTDEALWKLEQDKRN